MARYLARPCPRCGGYVGITIREPAQEHAGAGGERSLRRL